MHVVVDLIFLVPGETGGRETYVRELLPALRRARPDWRLTGVVAREAAGRGWWRETLDDVVVLEAASGRARGRWALGELALLPRSARGADLVHAPANFGPLHGAFARVLTVHDVIWRRVPDSVPAPVRALTTAMVGAAARRADRVLTVSEAARADLVDLLGLAADRIVVAPNGAAPPATTGDAARGRALAGVQDGRPIVLSVATDLPHKQLDAVARAVAAMPAAHRPVAVYAGRGTERFAGGADTRGLGPVDPAQLEDLYAAAALLALTTRYEGFGLPLLEALLRGVPVVCTDLAVLREVGGDAARYVDTADPAAFAGALAETLAGGPEVQRRRAAGGERAAGFTWARSAQATAQAFEAAVAAR